MNVFETQERLRTTGSYITPPESRRKPYSSLLASARFHLRMAAIFVLGNYDARCPDFETAGWPMLSLRVMRIAEAVGAQIRFTGFEHVRNIKFPVVWTSNHMTSIETYLLPGVLTSFCGLQIVLKESLAHYPVFGRVVRSVRPIRILRKNAVDDLRKVFTEGAEGVAGGRSVLIFPQGQRMPIFDPATFNSMGAKLAIRLGVPLVPLAIRTDFMTMSRFCRDIGSIHPSKPLCIACGEPIPFSVGQRELLARSSAFVVDRLREWGRETGDRLVVDPPAK